MSNMQIARFALQVANMRPVGFAPLPDPAVIDLVEADWAEGVEIENVWPCDVTQAAETLSEERRGLCDRPQRTMAFRAWGTDRDKSIRLWMSLSRLASDRYAFPLFPDVTLLTSAASAVDTLACVTTERRFFRGGKVILVHLTTKAIEFAEIDDLTDTSIILTGAISGSFPAGTPVYPVIDAEIKIEHSGDAVTDSVYSATVTVAEVIGQSALPPHVQEHAGGFAMRSDGYPIFDEEPDWSSPPSVSIRRAGREDAQGRGVVVRTRGDRPNVQITYTMNFHNREDAWRVLRFMDSRRGRLRPFWIVNPFVLGVNPTVTTTYMDIDTDADIDDLDGFITHVALMYSDNTPTIVQVASVTVVGDMKRFTWSAAISASQAATVKRAASAHFVRFSGDSYNEKWLTNGCCSVGIDVVDVIDEANYEITDLEDTPDLGDGVVIVDGLLFWFDANHGMLDTNGYVTKPGDAVTYWNQVPGTLHPGLLAFVVSVYNAVQGWVLVTPSYTIREKSGLVQYVGTGTKAAPSDKSINNGKEFLQATSIGFEWDGLVETYHWGNFHKGTATEGVTIFFCFYDQDSTDVSTLLNFEEKLEIRTNGFDVYETYGVLDPNHQDTFSIDVNAFKPRVFVFRWGAGEKAKMWDAGTLIGESITTITQIGASTPGGVPVVGRVGPFDTCKFNSICLYNKKLSDADLNLVATGIANTYAAEWTDI